MRLEFQRYGQRRLGKMKVGVFFPGFDSTSGGGFTFEQEILKSLLRLAAQSRHEFIFYFYANAGGEEKPLPMGGNIHSYWIQPRKPVPPLRQYIYKVATIMGWDDLILTPDLSFQKAVERDKVQIMWFATSTSPPVEIPYIATIWDIQHRLQPWFPEVSKTGEWACREAFYSTFIRRATYVITPNQTSMRELSLFYNIPAERFRMLPHPTPEIDRASSEEEISIILKKYKLPTRYLFYPAQFWAHKNHANLLLALQKLRDESQLVIHLVLAGSDQGNLPYIQKLTEQLRLKDQVHFLGFIPREDLIALYCGALALVYVTLFGPENLPPLEAFACGCPVIASNVSGAEEQLGDAALLVNGLDASEIANAIKKMNDDLELRKSYINKGLTRAKKFTGSDFVKSVFTILDEFESVRRNWE
jgi:glycosyltransferase involved in cell wall biosynthesis